MLFPVTYTVKEQGFTLVELMIAMAVGGIVMAAVMTSFLSQHRSYLAQDDVVEMQQNVRVAMDMLTRDIRSAGYDPTNNAGAGITTALAGQISFTQDTNGDGDTADSGEIIDIGFSPAAGKDADRNGIPDTVVAGVPEPLSLGRQTGGAGNYQPMAENIQAIEFQYLDEDGNVTATLANIRSIQISILAVAGRPDQNFTNTMTYTAASGAIWGPYNNDHLRRRLLITTVQCRNLGL
jgi:type IV pilus assembly protein PilW